MTFILAGFLALGVFFISSPAEAKGPIAGLYQQNGKLIRALPNIPAGAHVVAKDLGSDGIPEILVGSPQGAKPTITLLRLDGSKIEKFALQNVKGTPSVRVAAGDVDGDKIVDIVAAFGPGATPEVRVYSQNGERKNAFPAFGEGFRGGVLLAVGDVTGDGVDDIVTTAGKGGGPFVVTYNALGERLSQFKAYPSTERSGVGVLVADTNSDSLMDIVTSTPSKNSLIKVFRLDGSVQSSFRSSTVTPGTLHAAALPEAQVIVGVAPGSAGLVTSFVVDGSAGSVKFYPFGKAYTAGVTVATVKGEDASDVDIIAVPNVIAESTVSTSGRSIVVDISEQRLRRYENGQLIATHMVSTGKWSMPTPLGSFAVRNKLGTAYSRRYALYMDNWMAFTPDGAYGIHSLPYWRLKNGSIYYEGTNHLGIRVSHGCIRLSPKESAVVFRWASVGTPVTIVQ